MVYLTFIKREEICSHGWLLPNNVSQLYSLAQFLANSYGKPSFLITAYDDASITNAKLVNLVFGIHGIKATRTLTHSAQIDEGNTFIKNLLSVMGKENHHIAVVVPDNQFEKFSIENNLFTLACVYSAENWEALLDKTKKTSIFSNDVPSLKIDDTNLKRFIDAAELDPFAY